MQIVELKQKTCLLVGSDINPYNRDFGCAPNISNDLNHLA